MISQISTGTATRNLHVAAKTQHDSPAVGAEAGFQQILRAAGESHSSSLASAPAASADSPVMRTELSGDASAQVDMQGDRAAAAVPFVPVTDLEKTAPMEKEESLPPAKPMSQELGPEESRLSTVSNLSGGRACQTKRKQTKDADEQPFNVTDKLPAELVQTQMFVDLSQSKCPVLQTQQQKAEDKEKHGKVKDLSCPTLAAPAISGGTAQLPPELSETSKSSVFAPDFVVKREKHERKVEADEPHALSGEAVTPTVSFAPPMLPTPETGATFRSSVLHALDKKVEVAGQFNEATDISEQPLPTANVGSVKSLEVSLRDAGLGDISVRAEMKDGLLHASVQAAHADAFLTASALHGFLEDNRVAVHTVHVEAANRWGGEKVVANFGAGTLSSENGGRDRREADQAMPGRRGTKHALGEAETRHQTAGTRWKSALPRKFLDRGGVSIHI